MAADEQIAGLTVWGRRVRAALILRGVEIDVLVPELNISRRTFERTMRGARSPRAWETDRIAELLGLPPWFIRDGIDDVAVALERADATLERVEGFLRTLEVGH